jgi:hypothetical protein
MLLDVFRHAKKLAEKAGTYSLAASPEVPYVALTGYGREAICHR